MRGRLQHRVFAADLISVGRHLEFVLHAPNDIEIRHPRLDHHHVGAFGEVERNLAQRFVAVGRVHLVGVFVTLAEVAGGTHGIAKRPVKARRVLRRISQYPRVDLPGTVELGADARDTSIHHVGRRNDIGASLRMAERLFCQRFERLVVEHVTARVVGGDQAVLPVAGIGIERHVGNDAEFGKFFLQRRDHARHETVRIPCLFGSGRLERRIDDGKQRQRRYAQRLRAFGRAQQSIQALSLDTGHRTDGLDAIHAFKHEDRINQVVWGEH